MPFRLILSWMLFTMLVPYCADAQEKTSVTSPADEPQSIPWNMEQLSTAPVAHPAEGYSDPELHAVMLEGLPYKGKPTQFFAWYGVPKVEAGKKVPAMVLVHGGGGTAFGWWVKQWNARGYAAIALDTSATMPGPDNREGAEVRPNPQGGPKGSDHMYLQLDDAIKDQWAYHSTANVILAHSFLRELPDVDPDQIGLTGISWGGYLTCIAAGVDPRFRFAVPVYGCGLLAVDSGWVKNFESMGPERQAKWEQYWDPARYLPNAKMPMLWINGDMDACFSLKIMRDSFVLPPGERYLSIQPSMGHSHTSGVAPVEIEVFAEQVLHGGRPLARCLDQGKENGLAWATFKDVGEAKEVRFVYTTDAGRWIGRKWTPTSAEWDAKTGRATFQIPSDATAWYFVVTDDRGLMASSEPME